MLAFAVRDASAQSNSSWSWWPFGHSANNSPPPPTPTDDAIDLNSKHEAGAEVYVAVAELYVKSGKFTQAEAQYKQALDKFPTDLRVLLGYAMLKDQMHDSAEALKLYREAERKHSDQPAVYNNLAMHYVQAEMLPEAIGAARHAVKLAPTSLDIATTWRCCWSGRACSRTPTSNCARCTTSRLPTTIWVTF